MGRGETKLGNRHPTPEGPFDPPHPQLWGSLVVSLDRNTSDVGREGGNGHLQDLLSSPLPVPVKLIGSCVTRQRRVVRSIEGKTWLSAPLWGT